MDGGGHRGFGMWLVMAAWVACLTVPGGGRASPPWDPGIGLGPPVEAEVFSPLPAGWWAHRNDPIPQVGPLRVASLAAAPDIRARPSLVLGWLPYWTVSGVTLHLGQLTHLAYMGVQVASGGQLVNPRHWTSGALVPLIEAANGVGVQVVLTLICFDAQVMDQVLGNPAMRSDLVRRVTSMVADGGGAGVNVDFEGLRLSRKADFVAFVRELKQALDAALGVSHVSVATPAVDWRGAYDYDELAQAADALVIMGYGYHYSGGSPGPISPLRPSARWGKYSLEWTLDDYDRYAGVRNRDRIALGLPLYGHAWPVEDDRVPGVATGKATSPSFATCRRSGSRWGWRTDVPSTTPWYYIPGGPTQVWCEDRASLTAKIALAARRGIAGVGFWALGYEEDLDDPWLALADGWQAAELPEEPDPGPGRDASLGDASTDAAPDPGSSVPDVRQDTNTVVAADPGRPSADPVAGGSPDSVAPPDAEPSGDLAAQGGDGTVFGPGAGGGGCVAGGAAAGAANLGPGWGVGAAILLAAWFRRRRAGRTASQALPCAGSALAAAVGRGEGGRTHGPASESHHGAGSHDPVAFGPRIRARPGRVRAGGRHRGTVGTDEPESDVPH